MLELTAAQYSEATDIVEEGRGEFRGEEDMEIVGQVFGFAKKDIGAVDAEMTG